MLFRSFPVTIYLTENDLVAQYHEDGSVDFVKPTEYYNMSYSGKMVSFKDQFDKVDILVTPNHRMVARESGGKIKIFEAGDTSYQNRKGYSDKRDLIVSGNVKGIRGLSAEDRLRIAFQADGSLPNRADSYKNGQMRFSLKRQRKIIRLLSILKETGFQYSLSNVDARGYVSFWINPNDPTFLKDKDFSWVDLSKMSGQEAVEFVEELEFWDGTRKHNTIIYSSTNLLADQVGLNLKKLKMGFKQIYGDTVYGFLFDYKMDYARKLLDSGSYNVNEVGLKIGYSTGSHFIAAFKKKFATTPKKYLMSINTNV